MTTPSIHDHPSPTRIGPATFAWGARTFVMGILNVTPDSFSGDGLLAAGDQSGTDPVRAAVAAATAMVADGADILDIGGESTRPGHADVPETAELDRVVPVVAAVRAALPDVPISIDTTKPAVAEAALGAGADLVNDVWGVGPDDGLVRVAAAHAVPLVVMHNRAEPSYDDLVPEVVADLRAALERAVRLGVARERLIVDPGFGFGKTPEQNLRIVRRAGRAPVAGPADPAGHVAQVHAGPRAGPAGRRSPGGDPRDDRDRDRRGGGHRPRPRRPRQRPCRQGE